MSMDIISRSWSWNQTLIDHFLIDKHLIPHCFINTNTTNMADWDSSLLFIPETELLDTKLDEIFLPTGWNGDKAELGLHNIALLLSGDPISAPSVGGGGFSPQTISIDKPVESPATSSEQELPLVDLLSAACRAAEVDFCCDITDVLQPSTPGVPSPSRSESSPFQQARDVPSPASSLMSNSACTSPSGILSGDSNSPLSGDHSSGYSSFSSGGDPSSPRSDPDFPVPVSPTPSCFDEPMPEEEAPLKPSRPGPVPVKKPTDNYIALIGKAILSVPGRRMILADIINYILQEFPYYRTAPATWKTAIRHNLSVNDCFVKNGKADSGRGYYWSIHRACLDTFLKGDFRRSNARRLVQLMEKAKATAMKSTNTAYGNRPSAALSNVMTTVNLYGNLNAAPVYRPSSYSTLYPSTAIPQTFNRPETYGGHTLYRPTPQNSWSGSSAGHPFTNQQSQAYQMYGNRAVGQSSNTGYKGQYAANTNNGYYPYYTTGLSNSY